MIKIKTSCSPISLMLPTLYNSLPLISKFHPPSFPSIPSPPLYSHIFSFPFLLPLFFNFLSPSLHFLHPSSLFSLHISFIIPSTSLYFLHPSTHFFFIPLRIPSIPSLSLYFLLPSTPSLFPFP